MNGAWWKTLVAAAVLIGMSAVQGLAQSTITLSGSGSYLNLTGGAELQLGGSAGTSGQLLVSSGSGATPVWQSPSALGLVSGSGAANQVAFWTGTNALSGSANFTWNGTTLGVTGNVNVSGNVTAGQLQGQLQYGITAGTGLTGGTFNNTGNVTFALSNTGVTAGTYGSATQVAQITVDAQGRITSASNVAISLPAGSVAVVANAPLTGNGTTGSPLGLAINTTTLSVSGGQLTANNTSAIWNADQLCSTPLNCSAIGSLTSTDRKVLTWDGTQWTPWGIVGDGTTTTVTASGGNFTVAANNSSAIWNANQLQGRSVSSAAPNTNDVLMWNGSAWAPAPVSSLETDPQVDDGFSNGQIAFWSGTKLVGSSNLTWNGTTLGVTGNVNVSGNVTAGQLQGQLQYGITAGTGLTGGTFNNTGNVTFALSNTGVTAGTYGSATQIPVITVDAQGRITNASQVAVTGDNWGSQVAQVTPPITGNGTTGSPLGLAINTTTLSVSGGQLTANNSSAIWNANQLCSTPLNCGVISGLGSGDAGKVLQWDGTQWTAAGIGAAGGWAVGGNALTSNGALGTTTNYAVIFITNNTERMRLTTDGRLDFQGGSGAFRIDLPNSTLNGVGRIRANSYATYSSLRWKEDVRPIENALERVMQLNGYHFRWKPEYGGAEDIGFVMEEVVNVVPEVVYRDERTGELLGMEYSRLTALLVEALKAQVRQQEQVNTELRQRLERLESLVEQLVRERGERGGVGQGVEVHDAWLGQNIPNPFEGTTTIPYYIPAGVSRAELVVRDLGGRELRRVELSERGAHGQVRLEMRLLGSGTYEYSLVLDGRVVATRQMTLVR